MPDRGSDFQFEFNQYFVCFQTDQSFFFVCQSVPSFSSCFSQSFSVFQVISCYIVKCSDFVHQFLEVVSVFI